MTTRFTAAVILAASAAAGPAAGEGVGSAPAVVHVVLDLDAWTPGFQSSIHVPEGTTLVECVAVYVFDPMQVSHVWGVGYLGGIDRGIALGHVPAAANHGSLTGLTPTTVSPVNPGNVAWMAVSPAVDPGFAGPEVQYVEGGAEEPAIIAALPTEPIFTAEIMLDGAEDGDVFDLYLLDFVTVWTQDWLEDDHGAFSTQGPVTLDTGGDAVPDETQTSYGVDPDTPVAVPPAAFLVDYVDGPATGGPATIRIVPLGDLTGDGTVGISDLLQLLAAWGSCDTCGTPQTCPADLDGDCTVGIADFLTLLGNWT